MARMRASVGKPSDGFPPVSGSAAGCTGEADAATLALAETEAEAEAVVVGVADALGVGVSDAVGVGVSVGPPPACPSGLEQASIAKAPSSITNPDLSILPILFSFP